MCGLCESQKSAYQRVSDSLPSGTRPGAESFGAQKCVCISFPSTVLALQQTHSTLCNFTGPTVSRTYTHTHLYVEWYLTIIFHLRIRWIYPVNIYGLPCCSISAGLYLLRIRKWSLLVHQYWWGDHLHKDVYLEDNTNLVGFLISFLWSCGNWKITNMKLHLTEFSASRWIRALDQNTLFTMFPTKAKLSCTSLVGNTFLRRCW